MVPFLPWPGSKAKIAERIRAHFPERFGTYYEPFLGSGSVFFSLDGKREFQRARLSDVNRNLINCFDSVMHRPEHVKHMLRHCLDRNSEQFFNAMRSQMSNPSVFLYVMRAAFSSMYRENNSGQYNIPWRKKDFEIDKKPIDFDLDRLDTCSKYMHQKKVELLVADWMDAIQAADKGDLVYFDPPYLPYTSNGFVQYVKGGFNKDSHVLLNAQARLLAERGVYVVLSNSDVPASRQIYGEPEVMLKVANNVKSTATTKGTREEGLWIWRPKTLN